MSVKKLWFTPYAWHKLQYMFTLGKDRTKTEISGFGITEYEKYPNLVTDFIMPKQEVSSTSIEFDDEGLADFQYKMRKERKLKPEQFMRIWIHTHPGKSVTPSGTDEETFKKIFSAMPWGVMMILGDTGDDFTVTCYCRAAVQSGPFGALAGLIEIGVHWGMDSKPTDVKAWEAEFEDNVSKRTYVTPAKSATGYTSYYGNRNSKYAAKPSKSKAKSKGKSKAKNRKAGHKKNPKVLTFDDYREQEKDANGQSGSHDHHGILRGVSVDEVNDWLAAGHIDQETADNLKKQLTHTAEIQKELFAIEKKDVMEYMRNDPGFVNDCRNLLHEAMGGSALAIKAMSYSELYDACNEYVGDSLWEVIFDETL